MIGHGAYERGFSEWRIGWAHINEINVLMYNRKNIPTMMQVISKKKKLKTIREIKYDVNNRIQYEDISREYKKYRLAVCVRGLTKVK